MWPWGGSKRARVVMVPVRVRGTYDAAQDGDDNRKHWLNADELDATAANSPVVRAKLRKRARYEVANNSYARGIVLTLANDVIGTGPRLQLNTDDPDMNRLVERAFSAWSTEIDLAAKLRTMRMSRAQDGEAFAMLFSNEGLSGPIKLDLRLIEADQISTPYYGTVANAIDGIVLDDYGNPRIYHLLKSHPGAVAATYGKDDVPASNMVHWFRVDRPGQYRGIPDITSALTLFAQLRRYTLAVLTAAETAAEFTLFLKTNTSAGVEAAEIEDADLTEVEITRNMMTTLPEGWEPYQLQSQQPTTTYGDFKHEILNEIARCLNMPYNIAAGNSSGYNYSSGRLDHQTYYKAIRVEHEHCAVAVLDHILSAWLAEAVRALAWPNKAALSDATHQWFWDGHEHVDPAKEANAQATRLASHTTTLAAEYAQAGKDWETELNQRAKEVALIKQLGLERAPSPAPAQRQPQNSQQEDNQNAQTNEEE